MKKDSCIYIDKFEMLANIKIIGIKYIYPHIYYILTNEENFNQKNSVLLNKS